MKLLARIVALLLICASAHAQVGPQYYCNASISPPQQVKVVGACTYAGGVLTINSGGGSGSVTQLTCTAPVRCTPATITATGVVDINPGGTANRVLLTTNGTTPAFGQVDLASTQVTVTDNVNLSGPAVASTVTGTFWRLTCGNGGVSDGVSAGGNGGLFVDQAGIGGAASGGAAGGVGGSFSGIAGTGGACGAGAGAGGTGGAANLTGGDGGAGTATGVAGAGGRIQIFAGSAGANGGAGGANGGLVSIQGGFKSGAGTDGVINIGTNAGVTHLGSSANAVKLDGNTTLATGLAFIVGSNTWTIATDLMNIAKLAIASQATGDILYYDGSQWQRMAKCANGQILRWNATIPTCSAVYETSATISTGTTGAGTVNTTIFTLPSGLTSNTNAFDLIVKARVITACSGTCTGTITFTCGTANGGAQYIASQSVAGNVAAGTLYGLTTATAGSACTSGNLYDCVADGATSVICTTVLAGTLNSAITLNISVTAQGM